MKLSVLLLCVCVVSCGSDGKVPPGTIGTQGGTVTSADGLVSITIPAGALTESKTITVTPVATTGTLPGTAYTFEPDGLTFSKPVTIAIKYDSAKVPVGANEADLRLIQVLEPEWLGIADAAVDTASKTVSGTVTHFSTYGVYWMCGNFNVQLRPLNPPIIAPGATQTFTMTVVHSETWRVNVTMWSRFRSSDPGVATISGGSAFATATGVGAGIATIIANYGVCVPNEYRTTLLVLDLTDGGVAADGGTPADGGTVTDAGIAVDAGTAMTCTGESRCTVTWNWTVNGQPATAATCGAADGGTRSVLCHLYVPGAAGSVVFRSAPCTAGTLSAAGVPAGSYNMRAMLYDPPYGIIDHHPPFLDGGAVPTVTVQVPATTTFQIAFTRP